MDRRFPSKSSALTNRSTIRHRSGAFSPTVGASTAGHQAQNAHVKRKNSVSEQSEQSEQSERTDHTLTVQVEDTDAVDVERRAPTVLLVRRSQATSRAKPLPLLPGEEFLTSAMPGESTGFLAAPDLGRTSPILDLSPIVRDAEPTEDQALSPVPLTPRPAQPQREASVESTHP